MFEPGYKSSLNNRWNLFFTNLLSSSNWFQWRTFWFQQSLWYMSSWNRQRFVRAVICWIGSDVKNGNFLLVSAILDPLYRSMNCSVIYSLQSVICNDEVLNIVALVVMQRMDDFVVIQEAKGALKSIPYTRLFLVLRRQQFRTRKSSRSSNQLPWPEVDEQLSKKI